MNDQPTIREAEPAFEVSRPATSDPGQPTQPITRGEKKSLRERFNDNSLIFVCLSILGAFGAGWGLNTIIQTNIGLMSITKNEYDRLKNGNTAEKTLTSLAERVAPDKELTFSLMKEHSGFFDLLVDYFVMEGEQQSYPYKKTEVLEYKINESTKDFIWALTTKCSCTITGRGFKISSDNSIQPLDFEIVSPGKSLNIYAKTPDKGDRLVAVVRMSSDQDFPGVNLATLESVSK